MQLSRSFMSGSEHVLRIDAQPPQGSPLGCDLGCGQLSTKRRRFLDPITRGVCSSRREELETRSSQSHARVPQPERNEHMKVFASC